jgi:hypothetical protein
MSIHFLAELFEEIDKPKEYRGGTAAKVSRLRRRIALRRRLSAFNRSFCGRSSLRRNFHFRI